jgi:hypothetical protein
MSHLYTLADLEQHFGFEPSPGHTIARNRLRALRPALERRGWLTTVPPGNALAVKQEGLPLFARLQAFMAEGKTQDAAAALVLEEIGDKEAMPTVDPASMRETLDAIAEFGEKVGQLRADIAQAEARYMSLQAGVNGAQADAQKAIERLDELERRVTAMEAPWWRRFAHRLALPAPQDEEHG